MFSGSLCAAVNLLPLLKVSSHLRLCWYGCGFDVQDVQLLDTPSANRHSGVSQSHGGSPPGTARAAAGGVVLRPLLAGQGGAAAGPVAHRLGHAQLAVGHLIRELVILQAVRCEENISFLGR